MDDGHGDGPVRTCIGCRRSCPAAGLLRIVVDPAGPPVQGGPTVVVLDLQHRLPGRGAWLHDDPGCFDKALARRAVGRALRRQDPLDLSALQRYPQDR